MGTKTVARGITRFDIKERSTHGYMVRITRQGNKHQKFFADTKWGGKRAALTAAKEQLAQWEQELPELTSARDRLTARNQSGQVGVYLAVSRDSQGQEHEAYCGCWTDAAGQRRKVSFSVKKFGKRRAWALACLARELEQQDRDEVLVAYEQQQEQQSPRRKK
jgi:hypothetical protein